VGWIQQHYYETIALVLAAISALLAWLQFRKKEPSTTSLEHSRVQHSAIISGSNNEVHIGHATSPVVSTEPPKTERTVPNLVYAGARRKDIFVSPSPQNGICDPSTQKERETAIHALVLKFENRIVAGDRKIARALNVIAKLKFRHKNGVTERHISYGVWLNSSCNSTDIGIGDTRELVLLAVIENKFVTFEDRRVDNRSFGSEGFLYLEDGDVEGYELVDVTLIDQPSQATLSITLKVWRQGESICTSEL